MMLTDGLGPGLPFDLVLLTPVRVAFPHHPLGMVRTMERLPLT